MGRILNNGQISGLTDQNTYEVMHEGKTAIFMYLQRFLKFKTCQKTVEEKMDGFLCKN